MCSSFDCVDVVDVGVYVFVVGCVVHDGHFDGCALFFGVEVYYVVEEVCTTGVYVSDEFFESFFTVECFLVWPSLFVGISHVCEDYCDACVEVCEFSHSVCEYFVFIGCCGEYGGIGPELLSCASEVGLSDDAYVVEWFAFLVFLLVYMAVAVYL